MAIVYHLGYIYNLNSEIASTELTEGLGWSCYKSHRPLVFSALNSVSLGSKNPQVQNIWWAEWAGFFFGFFWFKDFIYPGKAVGFRQFTRPFPACGISISRDIYT